ncbi:MAG: hypothetical protein GF333_03765 [Candidatus Omnitrophica bacterium]|nr:hypothetical protein [Candidatus Omnitrophota bacterium]
MRLCILLLLCAGSLIRPAGAKDPVEVLVFYSQHCGACHALKQNFFPAIEEKHADITHWRYLETSNNPQHLQTLIAATEHFRDEESPAVPAVLVGQSFLVGTGEIKKNLDRAIALAYVQGTPTLSFEGTSLVGTFRRLSFMTVVTGGLIDGVNPCAFAVIIFFVSFLSVYGYGRREIVAIGTFYCLAVFLTYLLMGFGLFEFFYSLSQISLFITYFYRAVALFCFALFALTIFDYVRFKRSGRTDSQVLQLPHFLKVRIHRAVGSRLRGHAQQSSWKLVASAFSVGVIVSLLEAACTGQIYIPTIVYILKNTSYRLKAFVYLLAYNFMFVLPLLVIFGLALFGVRSEKFQQVLKKDLGGLKLLMALLFLVLGILLFRYG